MRYEQLSPQQRVTAVNMDCMQHKKFCLLAHNIATGKSLIKDDVPTACTNGKDKYYGEAFVTDMPRKELRYVVLHENFHVALKHCIMPAYVEAAQKHPKHVGIAMDYVVNGLIESIDPLFEFVDRPSKIKIYVDKKYNNMSFPQVLRVLLKEMPEPDEEDQPLDQHDMSAGEDGTPEEVEKMSADVDAANTQGEIMAKKLSPGDSGGGESLLNAAKDRRTDWRPPLRKFLEEMCEGDDVSRICPPNKRLRSLGFMLPSHYSEATGEIILACDTSGSMEPYYGMIFGEIARICKQVQPVSVRVLWWDTSVREDQQFTPDKYAQIGKLLKPKGGGGTIAECVVDYVKEKKYKPKALVWITDGEFWSSPPRTTMPSIWAVVNNASFKPPQGSKVLRISA
jgi:predicted metal-dependent peptidase